MLDWKIETVKTGALYHVFDSILLTRIKLLALNILVIVSKQRVIETWLLRNIISYCWQSWFSLIAASIVHCTS